MSINDASKHRRIRVALLQLLKTEYPGPLDLRALQFALDNLGYPMLEGSLEAHLAYLEEKGYAKTERRKGKGYAIAFSYLTSSGWDLLDGLSEDCGVDSEL